MRKLASIQVIESLDPIPGADAIECAHILGWRVVVKKGEYRPGDRVIYCEVDSYLPERPEYEFLRKSCWRTVISENGEELLRGGFRIRTVKLRGQVSQGLCLPLAGVEGEVGDDVTEALGIIKYDPPVPAQLRGRAKGNFPALIPKTDETRVQILRGALKRHRGETFYLTEKVDGSSCTIFVTPEGRGICSRNLLLDENDPNLTIGVWVKETGLFERMKAMSSELGAGLVLQGELLGPGIQKNRYALAGPHFLTFNVLTLKSDEQTPARLVAHSEMLRITEALGVPIVPQLGTIELNHTVDDLIEMSRGKSRLNPKVHREGIVFRPLEETQDPELGRLSFKAINPDFLLKYDE